MKTLLTPKLDYVFKKLFTRDVDLLINLINSVLMLKKNDQIISIDIKNPEILPDHIKYSDFSYCFELRDRQHPELIYADDLSIYLFELPKVSRDRKLNELPDNERKQFEWMHFLNYAHEGGSSMQKAYYSNPMVHRAFDLLAQISEDEQTRKDADFRERAIRNKLFELNAAKKEGFKEGIEKGIEKGRLEEILNGIELGLDLKFGEAGLKLLPEINKIDRLKTLMAIHNGIRSSDTVEGLRQIFM